MVSTGRPVFEEDSSDKSSGNLASGEGGEVALFMRYLGKRGAGQNTWPFFQRFGLLVPEALGWLWFGEASMVLWLTQNVAQELW